jgi:hypothetical protein
MLHNITILFEDETIVEYQLPFIPHAGDMLFVKNAQYEVGSVSYDLDVSPVTISVTVDAIKQG